MVGREEASDLSDLNSHSVPTDAFDFDFDLMVHTLQYIGGGGERRRRGGEAEEGGRGERRRRRRVGGWVVGREGASDLCDLNSSLCAYRCF